MLGSNKFLNFVQLVTIDENKGCDLTVKYKHVWFMGKKGSQWTGSK